MPTNRDGRTHRSIYLILAVLTILVGLFLRLVPLGFPFLIVRYGGSVLWATMLYLLFATIQPKRTPLTLAILASILAALVELSRLYHSPGLDAFRLTLAGALLLGRVFTPWHFLAYWAAIAITAIVDQAARLTARAANSRLSRGRSKRRK
ncbi:ribosomal maturation YjgA family protein [Acidicapsa ligni]|uniref:ribosomal maturation YjgA family protein n=1 Tax=Acidicapsa ligni TaxID=542300 RepID=UPI0021DFE2D8|nr:DUF2809 domain-containing protein [Acidicapsa ligni]